MPGIFMSDKLQFVDIQKGELLPSFRCEVVHRETDKTVPFMCNEKGRLARGVCQESLPGPLFCQEMISLLEFLYPLRALITCKI